MSIITNLLAIALVASLGFTLSGYFTKRQTEKLGLSLPLGLGAVSLLLPLVNLALKLPLNPAVSFGSIALLTLVLALIRPPQIGLKLKLRFSALEKLLILLLLAFSLGAFLSSYLYPVSDWDAITVYDYRAQTILATEQIDPDFIRPSAYYYPLLTTMTHFWLYLSGSPTAMPAYPLIFTGFLLALFGVLQRFMPRTRALVTVLAVSLSPRLFENTFIAYANMPYAVYLSLGTLYLYAAYKKWRVKDFILGTSLCLLAMWTRNFPFALLAPALTLGLLAYQRATPKLRTVAILSTTIALLLFAYIARNILAVLPEAINFIHWALVENFSPLFPALALLLIAQIWSGKINLYWFFTLLGQFGLIVLGTTYLVYKNTAWLGNPDALQRTALFFPVLIILYLLITLPENLLPPRLRIKP
jgi:hypothetical protein